MIKALLCAAAIVAAPVVASATVVEPGSFGSDTKTLTPGIVTSFYFEPTAETTFTFTVSATGLASDITKLTYGYSPVAGDQTFSEVVTFGPIGVGVGMIDALTTDTPFYVYFFDNGALISSILTVTYTTDEATPTPAPVPLPAAGGLLMLALAGMGGAAATRRRK